MNILHTCESYWPTVSGVQEVVQRLSEGLAARGHKVTVATTYHPDRVSGACNGVAVEQFDVQGKWTRGFRGEVKRYQRFIRAFEADVMMNYAALQWSTDLIFPILKELKLAKVLVPCGYSTLRNWKWWLYYRRLPSILRRYDHVVYLSDRYQDKEFGDRHGIDHASTIGNGAADEDFLQQRTGFRSKYGITTARMFLCVSNYGPGKNQEMVLRAYRHAMVPDSTLVFIGSRFNDYADKLRTSVKGQQDNIRFLEQVPRQDVVTAYHEADLFLFGSVVECFPLVIVEAMASSTPFISTDVGCVRDLAGGIIVASSEEMASQMRLLAHNGSAWQELAHSGRQAWEHKHRWDTIIDQYEQLYHNLLTIRY